MILIAVVVYLFLLVYIESDLVESEARNERLKNRFTELQNEKKHLESEIMDLSNLAVIEIQAKRRNFVFPEQQDILGVVK